MKTVIAALTALFGLLFIGSYVATAATPYQGANTNEVCLSD